jgi:hypothetical protein
MGAGVMAQMVVTDRLNQVLGTVMNTEGRDL